MAPNLTLVSQCAKVQDEVILPLALFEPEACTGPCQLKEVIKTNVIPDYPPLIRCLFVIAY